MGHDTSIRHGAAATGRRRVVLAALAALVLAGCGGSEPRTAAGGAQDAPVVGVDTPGAEVGIDAPLNGAKVTADEIAGARLIAEVEVEGTGEPGAGLVLQSSCQEAECRKPVTVDPGGTFKTQVPVWSTKGASNGYIVAGVRGSAPADRARVLVLLGRPKGAGLPRASRSLPSRTSERAHSEPRAAESEPLTDAAAEAGGEPAPAAPASLPAAPQPIPAPTGGSGTFVMIGDSLAEGTEPYLGGLLSGWTTSTDARAGRPLGEGMGIFGRTSTPSGRVVLAFSLFTNDSPGNVAALESAVRESVRRAGAGCAIWATIARPPQRGVSYKAANQRLRALERDPGLRGRLLVVPWAETVAADPALLGSDRVHATAVGYQTRASLYAQAAGACLG